MPGALPLPENEEFMAEDAPAGLEPMRPLQPALKLNYADSIELGLGVPRAAPGRPRAADPRMRALSLNVTEFSMSPEQFRAPRAPEVHLPLRSAPTARRQRPLADLDIFSVTAGRTADRAGRLPAVRYPSPKPAAAAAVSLRDSASVRHVLAHPRVLRDPPVLFSPFASPVAAASPGSVAVYKNRGGDAVGDAAVDAAVDVAGDTMDVAEMPPRSSRQKHQCDVCMNWYASVETHKLSHGAARPFRCSQCSREFSRLYDLLRHKRMHEVPGLRCPYWMHEACHRTGSFNRGDTYKRHMIARHFVAVEGAGSVGLAQRQHAAGKCKACGHPFVSALAWMAQHIESTGCPGFAGEMQAIA